MCNFVGGRFHKILLSGAYRLLFVLDRHRDEGVARDVLTATGIQPCAQRIDKVMGQISRVTIQNDKAGFASTSGSYSTFGY